MWGISITIHRNNFLQDSIYPEITYDAMMLRIRLLPGGFIRILLSEKRTKALTLTFFFGTIYRSFDAVCYEIKGLVLTLYLFALVSDHVSRSNGVSNFWVYGQNPVVMVTIKWNHFGSTFTWYYFLSCILQDEI